MPINWNKIIPRWGGDTIEPPEDKKDTGYFAGDKPPAKWENWLRKGTYEALDETRDVIEGIDSQLAQKANKQQESWITPTLMSGWLQYGECAVEYFKDDFGIVHLKGVVTEGAIYSTVFTLPTSYTPTEDLIFTTLINNTPTLLHINSTTGNIIPDLAAGSGKLSLNGIKFRAR